MQTTVTVSHVELLNGPVLSSFPPFHPPFPFFFLHPSFILSFAGLVVKIALFTSLLLFEISSTYSVCSDKLLLTFRLSLGTVSLLFYFSNHEL